VDPTTASLLKLLEEITTGLHMSRLEVGAAVKVACKEGLVQPHEDVSSKRWQLTDEGLRQQRDIKDPA
jgi:hypothetical protein